MRRQDSMFLHIMTLHGVMLFSQPHNAEPEDDSDDMDESPNSSSPQDVCLEERNGSSPCHKNHSSDESSDAEERSQRQQHAGRRMQKKMIRKHLTMHPTLVTMITKETEMLRSKKKTWMILSKTISIRMTKWTVRRSKMNKIIP